MRSFDISDELFGFLLGQWEDFPAGSVPPDRVRGVDSACEEELADLLRWIRRWTLVDEILREIGLEPVEEYPDDFPGNELYENSDTWGAEALLGHT